MKGSYGAYKIEFNFPITPTLHALTHPRAGPRHRPGVRRPRDHALRGA